MFRVAYETCASDWSLMQVARAEVLILSLHAKHSLFPDSMDKMMVHKVLTITNDGLHPSELNNFDLLDSLHNLKTITLKRITVPSFGTFNHLIKLFLYMCTTKMDFGKGSGLITHAFPNLN
uniref:Putative disease resistance protein n=1 Tax=Trifolium alexandrinum TaxID=97006 RepID=A0A7U3W7V2_9FABA|nr:putative disease resistance protein [Trifolium alexandrinum]